MNFYCKRRARADISMPLHNLGEIYLLRSSHGSPARFRGFGPIAGRGNTLCLLARNWKLPCCGFLDKAILAHYLWGELMHVYIFKLACFGSDFLPRLIDSNK